MYDFAEVPRLNDVPGPPDIVYNNCPAVFTVVQVHVEPSLRFIHFSYPIGELVNMSASAAQHYETSFLFLPLTKVPGQGENLHNRRV